jgi:CopG family nickel-responsive transcriptional regulator
MTEKGVSRISVSVPPELLRKFDDAVKRIGYEDRSKAIQAAMRDLVTESKWICEDRGNGIGAIAMIYGHHLKGLEEIITDIEHRHTNTVISSMHVHLDEDNCLEIIAVRGRTKEIQELSNEIKTKRGVKQLKLAIVTV